jgi:hypothetical protein
LDIFCQKDISHFLLKVKFFLPPFWLNGADLIEIVKKMKSGGFKNIDYHCIFSANE